MSNHEHRNPEIGDALAFESLLYVLGELDQEAASRFEERMQVDWEVALAVADAVRQIEMVAAAEEMTESCHSRPWHSRARATWQTWFRTSVASAAAVAAVVAGMLLMPRGDRPDSRTASAQHSSALAMVWAETSDLVADDLEEGWRGDAESDWDAAFLDSGPERLDAEYLVAEESWIAAAIEGMAVGDERSADDQGT